MYAAVASGVFPLFNTLLTWRMGERPEWANRWYEPTAAVRAALRAEAKFVADVWPGVQIKISY